MPKTERCKCPQLLSFTAVAERLGCSRTHIYNLVAVGDLPVVEIAPSTSTKAKSRVKHEDLEAFIDKRTRTAGRSSVSDLGRRQA